MDELGNKRLIKSYVWFDDKCFFVSTIDRDSSAPYGGRFSETMVWEFNWDDNERGNMAYEEGGVEGMIKIHQAICERIFETGNPEQPLED